MAEGVGLREIKIDFTLGEDSDVRCPECGFAAEGVSAMVRVSMGVSGPVRATNAAVAVMVATADTLTISPCGCTVKRWD